MHEPNYRHNLPKTNTRVATTLTRLKEIDQKASSLPKSHLQRWCAGGACACMGCANLFFKSKTEWQDYIAWVNANKPNSMDAVAFSHKTEIPFKLKE